MKPFLEEGNIRAIAIGGDKRSHEFPDVQTVKVGLPEYARYVWTALAQRSDTPPDVVGQPVGWHAEGAGDQGFVGIHR